MTIPNEAVEAAARAIEFHHDWSYEGDGICCMGCGIRLEGLVPCNYDLRRSAVRRHQAQSALEAALPHIEKEIRAQVAAELRGELPVQLAETAGSDTGWLSDMQGLDQEVGGDTEWVSFFDDNANDISSIDISHIAEHAAKIAEGENK